jgi:hypothetical protein
LVVLRLLKVVYLTITAISMVWHAIIHSLQFNICCILNR